MENRNEKIDEIKREIIESEYAGDRGKLIDELIAICDKRDVEPAHFRIDEKDVLREYDCESFILSECGGFMHYKTKGGYNVFVSPDYGSIYNTLKTLLDILIENKEAGVVENDTLANMCDFVSSLVFSPTIMFMNEDIMFKSFDFLNGIMQDALDAATKELSQEDFDKSKEFEQAMKTADEAEKFLKEVQDMHGDSEQ